MPAIQTKKCLPPQLAIDLVDDILYRIGLCLTSVRDRPIRPFILDPLIIFVVNLVFILPKLISLMLEDDNETYFDLLGDVGHFVGLRREMDIYFILATMQTIAAQMLYYYNYKKGIKPTFLAVFQMMAGLLPPNHLNLVDKKSVLILVEFTRKAFNRLRINNDYIMPIISFLYTPALLLEKGDIWKTLVIGIPYGTLTGLWGNSYFNVFMYQILCFYILCLYLKLRIDSLNERLIEMKRRRRFNRIRETLQSIDDLFSEITEYDTIVWSKFIAIVWIIFGSNAILVLYMAIFVPMAFGIRFILVYGAITLISAFLFMIFTASSVNSKANQFYKTLISFAISYNKYNQHNYSTRIKINLKLMTMIERTSEKSVGFTCWNLFTINYYRCYEILGLLTILMLKIIEMRRNE